MNKLILLELAKRWVNDSNCDEPKNGSKEAEIPNAIAKGIREGKRECADTLRTLIKLLGED